MSIKRLLTVVIILVVLGGIGFLAFISGSNYLAEKGATDAGNAYMQAIRDGDFAAAYVLSDPAFQSQMGDAAGIQNTFAGRGFYPDAWNFHDASVESNLGTLQASVTLTNGERMGIELGLSKIDGAWRISRIELINS